MVNAKRTFTFLFVMGSAILLLGLFFILYPDSVISGLKEQISQATSLSQKAILEGKLYSENLDRATYYQPISFILVATSLLIIAYSILSTVIKISAKTSKNKTEKIILPKPKDAKVIYESRKSHSDIERVLKPTLDSIQEKKDIDFEEKIRRALEKEIPVTSKKDTGPIIKEELGNTVFSATVILESKQGTKLYKDRLVHEGRSYPISDMKQASVKSEFLHLPSLEIIFNSGEKRDFQIGSAANTTVTDTLLSDGMIDNISDNLRMTAQKWASTINTLIAMRGK